MPRYYFNVINGHFTRDTEGSEFRGIDKARREALMRMGEMLHERRTNG
jgi:hypothetical protein